MVNDRTAAQPRVQRTNVRRLYEQAIGSGDDVLLRRVQDYLVGQGWIGGAPGQLNIEEAIAAVEA